MSLPSTSIRELGSTPDVELAYDPGVHLFATAIGLSVLGSFGSLLLASVLLLLKPKVRIGSGPAPDQLRRRHAARRGAAVDPARGAPRPEPRADGDGPARRHHGLLRPREARALASLPQRGLRDARPARRPHPHRPRLPQFRGRRGDRRRGPDLDPAWGEHGRRRGPARSAAAGGRFRRPASRGLPARAGARAERPVGGRCRHRDGRGLPGVRVRCPACCPTR